MFELCETPLIYASKNGNIKMVKLFLEQEDININDKDFFNRTPLIIACEKGYTEIVKLLLEQENININAVDDIDRSALIFAIANENIEIVKLLLEQENIKVTLEEINKFIPEGVENDEIINLLLQKGINIKN